MLLREFTQNNLRFQGILKRLILLFWKNDKVSFILGILTSILATIGMLYNQIFIGKIIVDNFLYDVINNPNYDINKFNWQWFTTVIILSSLCFVFSILINYVNRLIFIYICQKIITDLRDELYKQVQSLPLGFLNKEQKGKIIACFNSDMFSLKTFLVFVVPNLINSLITLIISIITMFILSWQLSLIMVGMMFIITLFTYQIGQKSRKLYHERQSDNAKLFGFTEEVISGFKLSKTYNQETQNITKFTELANSLAKKEFKANAYSQSMFPLTQNLGNIGYLCVTLAGAILIIRGKSEGIGLTIGVLIAFTQFAKSFASPIATILRNSSQVLSAIAGGRRIFNLMDQTPEVDQGQIEIYKNESNELFWKILNNNTKVPFQGLIEYKNVSFRYKDKQILNNISFKVLPGQKVALIGPTGAGKTTIINLLSRFYEINDGEILIDGINIKDIKKESLRSVISLVLQEVHLFSDSIKNNIIYGSEENFDLNHFNNSLMVSDLIPHLEKLQEKENTILLNSGSNLSQGQKQLISIARANYKNSKILIMDEATSNIDTKTELIVQQAMDKSMQNKSTILIAHRLSTIKNSDLILVINNGEIKESGNHLELIQKNGIYKELWMKSME